MTSLQPNGIYQALRERAKTVGVKLHPHLLRHTLAHHWELEGLGRTALKANMGWESDKMPDHYAKSASHELAIKIHHDRFNLGDRI